MLECAKPGELLILQVVDNNRPRVQLGRVLFSRCSNANGCHDQRFLCVIHTIQPCYNRLRYGRQSACVSYNGPPAASYTLLFLPSLPAPAYLTLFYSCQSFVFVASKCFVALYTSAHGPLEASRWWFNHLRPRSRPSYRRR